MKSEFIIISDLFRIMIHFILFGVREEWVNVKKIKQN